ncbi:MAG TPA: M20 family metallopeptidase, partial [Terriglobales bacterium]|nr:M20 family metallopeptidase [Terriglobales bacterium]
MSASTLLDWIEPRRGEMLARLRAWVEVETPSLEPERVRELAAAVAAEFEPLGYRARFHPDALELTCAGAAPILLLGHLDTVYAAGTLATMPFREEGGRVYGPGVFDMKGGAVQALYALQALRAGAPGVRLPSLLLVFDEETGSRRSRALTERLARQAEAVLVLEPAADADGKLKLGRKGIALYTLAAFGVAAHAGVDFEQGASAIVELAARVAEVAGWSEAARGLTLNPGLIAGGSRVNVVAAEARAEIEVRAWTAAELEAVEVRLRGLASAHPRVRLELSGGINRPPMEPTPASQALAARAQALARELGFALATTRTGGGSDGNFTAALGVPTLDGLGMVGAGAHTPQEQIELAALGPRTALLAALLAG